MQEEPKNEEAENDDNWENDQKRRSYYYDDAYGYEVYQPEKDEDEKENED